MADEAKAVSPTFRRRFCSRSRVEAAGSTDDWCLILALEKKQIHQAVSSGTGAARAARRAKRIREWRSFVSPLGGSTTGCCCWGNFVLFSLTDANSVMWVGGGRGLREMRVRNFFFFCCVNNKTGAER